MLVEHPVRVRHTYRQHLNAPPAEVFPLLGPVRECDWVPDWNPSVVYSDSGVVEPDCVFLIPEESQQAIWVTTEHNSTEHIVEFVKVTPGHTVGHISIQLQAAREGGATATITYQYTALSPTGEAFVRGFTEDAYAMFMQQWKRQLNHYLQTGQRLETDASKGS